MSTSRSPWLWVHWLIAGFLCLHSLPAKADLMLFPTRVVFEKDQRSAQVELVNQGKTPETYRISVVNRRMGETGEFIVITEPGPGEQFAESMLRYSPRQVTIAPGSAQTVRILLRKPAELAPGEYRSHLQFDRVADASGSNSVEELGKDKAGGVGVVLSALVGASIPVIVRHGDTQAQVALRNLAFQAVGADKGAAVSFDILREGNRSVYGDISVTFTPKVGISQDLVKASGVAVYVPNPLRKARMPFTVPEGTVLSGGTLKVSYRERAEAGGALLAESSLTLP
ncbi:MAG TPA: molecular chaperone [Aquabacterium sp.]|uniref:fimbrial biogenesis chaperone n=1 Tax=Aquabacterium sp. TaxID=1872578 RepID=UPI002E2EAD69|nr:molecular chaperone [Aquabacterium sp.]HEX5355291.1 molecular chaperone [Aquabacterium sp.]